MLSFHDASAIAGAPNALPANAVLQQLIADRVHDWMTTDLMALTNLVIVQAGDSEDRLIEEIAFTPLANAIDGQRFGSTSFEPSWDWLERHDGWFEMIVTVGNDGFAFVLFIEDSAGLDPALHRLCETYAPATRQ